MRRPQALDRRDAIDASAAALMLLLTFSWGLNGVAAKLANTGFNSIFLTMARSAIAAVLVFAWCRYRGIALFGRDGSLGPGIVAGLLFGAEFSLIFIGLEYTSVARSALLVNTMPFWILIGAHFWLGERMTPKKLIGLLLAFLGVVLVFSDKLSLPGPEAIVGDLLSIGAGLLWAATTLVIKATRLVRTSAEKLLLYQLAVSSVMRPRCCRSPDRSARADAAVGRLTRLPGCLCRRVHLYSVVLADAPLPGGGLVELYLLDPRLCSDVRRAAARRAAQLEDLCGARSDCRRPGPGQSAAASEAAGSGVMMRDILKNLEAGRQLSDPDPVRRAQIQ